PAPPPTARIAPCAPAPTRLSDIAVAMRSQIDSSVAASARPSQSAARAYMSVIGEFSSRSAITLDRGELGREARVDQAHAFLAQQDKQLLGFVGGDHELHHDGHVGSQLEEVLLVQDAVAPEAGDGPERGAAVDAEILGLL